MLPFCTLLHTLFAAYQNYQREQIFYNGQQDNNQHLQEKNRKTDKKVEKTPNNHIKVEVSKHYKLKCRPVYAIRQYQIGISGKSKHYKLKCRPVYAIRQYQIGISGKSFDNFCFIFKISFGQFN